MTDLWLLRTCATGLAAGMAAGAAHFAALRWNARYFAAGRLAVALGAQTVRCVLTALLLFALARAGSPALLAGMAGLLIARHATLRIAVRTQ
ncbi:N-ATPase subunit AtpR [Paraburkholderia lycopersici]|uniref:F1/F0 ATPase, subunit 2 n=1 Tax=Paraburkholderia lycopersici TaxID=416944 RepID=A0A1G6SGF1_9BURK|nr:ATP synthase subunit I [Paraburkholderia lycopersici]SDD16000.1 F1/F0 ATPase, subunit 2 [Paraburkholderia lycopersici]